MQGIGRVSFNTTMAACSGGLMALFISYFRTGKWDLGLTVNGFLGGLVAITAPCYWVSPMGSFVIGAVAAFVVIYGLDLLGASGLVAALVGALLATSLVTLGAGYSLFRKAVVQ